MRDLIQTEIDNAPDWATHYQALGDSVLFESESKTQLMVDGELGNLIPFGGVSETSKPIRRKELSIDEIQKIMRGQLKEVMPANSVRITCQCGRNVPINSMYRCHHCGIFFCRTCGNEHFGKDTTGLVGRISGQDN